MIGDPPVAASRRVLIVAPQRASDPALVRAVADRSAESRSDFTLLVPAVAHGLHRVVDPEDQCCEQAEAELAAAIPLLSEAAGAPITGVIGSHDPFAAVWDALNAGAYDEVIVPSTPNRLARWLRIDLARRIRGLGVTVSVIGGAGAAERDRAPLRRAA